MLLCDSSQIHSAVPRRCFRHYIKASNSIGCSADVAEVKSAAVLKRQNAFNSLHQYVLEANGSSTNETLAGACPSLLNVLTPGYNKAAQEFARWGLDLPSEFHDTEYLGQGSYGCVHKVQIQQTPAQWAAMKFQFSEGDRRVEVANEERVNEEFKHSDEIVTCIPLPRRGERSRVTVTVVLHATIETS